LSVPAGVLRRKLGPARVPGEVVGGGETKQRDEGARTREQTTTYPTEGGQGAPILYQGPR
jgi:hypothetical protein